MANVAIDPDAQDEYRVALAWYQSKDGRVATRFVGAIRRVLT